MATVPSLIRQIIGKNDTDTLNIGPDANAQDDHGVPAIHYAILMGKPNFCKQLITAGATISNIDWPLALLQNIRDSAIFRINVIQYQDSAEYAKRVNQCLQLAVEKYDFTILSMDPHILKLQLQLADARNYTEVKYAFFYKFNKSVESLKIVWASPNWKQYAWNTKFGESLALKSTIAINNNIQLLFFCVCMGENLVPKTNTGWRVFTKMRHFYY